MRTGDVGVRSQFGQISRIASGWMSQIVKVVARRRSELGKMAVRRLRREGLVPANVYGHGQDAIALALSTDVIRPVVNSGAHVVDLDVEGAVEKALIRD